MTAAWRRQFLARYNFWPPQAMQQGQAALKDTEHVRCGVADVVPRLTLTAQVWKHVRDVVKPPYYKNTFYCMSA